jgi:hypothetical protein
MTARDEIEDLQEGQIDSPVFTFNPNPQREGGHQERQRTPVERQQGTQAEQGEQRLEPTDRCNQRGVGADDCAERREGGRMPDFVPEMRSRRSEHEDRGGNQPNFDRLFDKQPYGGNPSYLSHDENESQRRERFQNLNERCDQPLSCPMVSLA